MLTLAFMAPTRDAIAGGDNNYYIYSNAYGGYEPWYTTSNSDAMNAVFGVGGWLQDYFETCDPALVFSANTNFVFLEGSDGFADELESFLSVNIDVIETWVEGGGRLLLNAAPNEGDGMSFGFGGVNLTYWGGSSNVHATDPTHPIFNGPYTPTGTSWTGSSFSHASVSGPDLTPLIIDDFTPTTIALSEGRYGTDGIVFFGGMTTDNFHYPSLESINLFQNILNYLAFYEIPDHDIASLSLASPSSGCGMGVETVSVNYKNYGTNDEVNIPVSYQLDGGAVVSATIAGPVAPGETVTYSFAVPADITALGAHTFVISCDLATDEIPANNTITVTINNIPVVDVFPYYQDFEAGDGGWIAGGGASSWELGSPAGFAIVGPPPATPGSVNSWTTSLTGYYNDGEKSYIESPCFDFSSLVFPYLELDLNWDTQMYSDGAKIQYSTDAGATWSDLGDVGTGENWYTSYNCYGMWPDFYVTDYRGWDGNSGGWQHGYQDLAFLGGQPSVKLRMVMGADLYWSYYDGFAFDNVKISDLFPNDVGVSNITAPVSGPLLSATESVSVAVTNYGTLAQSGFPVSYRFEGGPVHTETFTGTVNPGETVNYDFATTEDLSVLGDYTFEAWTSLATDEDMSNDSITEVISNLEPLTGDNAYYIISNTTGGEPWYTVSNSQSMDAVFGVGEWTMGYFETVDPAVVFGTGTCFVFLEGSDGHALELKSFLDANHTAIENWVASGGHLLLNAAPNEGSGMDFYFDGVELSYPYFSNTVGTDVPTHPAFTGPFAPTSTVMYGSSYGHATVSGDDLSVILYDYYNPSKIVLAEKSWGAGTVLFGGMTVTNYHSPLPDADNFRRNAISYLATCTISDNDMATTAILSPESTCGLTGAETITINVKNVGFLSQTDVPVSYQVDGGTIVTETIPGTIDVGEIVTYSFATTVNMAVPGDYNIVTWTDLATDTIYGNDTTYSTVYNVPTVASFPYYEDFEDGSKGWLVGGASTFELGTPAGYVINTPPTATPGSLNSWVTNLEGYYDNNEKGYVTSPCMDFTSLVMPYMELDINYDIQLYSDGAKIQYTLDEGASWSDLGNVGEGENWYDSYYCYSMWPTFYVSDYRGWQSTYTGWRTAHYDMSFLAGQPSVRFRIIFASDSYWNYNDGFAFDNVKIQDPFPNDVGVVDLISPESAVTLTGSEVVSVLLENFGTLPQTGFNVAYKVGAGTVHTELFTGTVDPGSTAVMTFAATEDFSADGLYNVTAWTELASDEDLTNDTLNAIVVNLTPVSGTDAFYIYSNVYGGYEPWYVTSNSDAMDAVFGDDGWFLEYVETLDPYAVFDENTCFVYLEGSDAQASELENFLTTNSSIVENWVASGGHLLLNSAPNEGDGMDFGFDGVTLNYSWYTSNVTAYDPSHPIFNGPWTPITTDYTGGSFGHASVSGGGIDPVIIDTYDASRYVLAEKEWGDGHVIFGGMTPPYFHSPSPDAQNLLQNIYETIKLCAPVDLGVVEIISPEGGCGMGVETITVTVENFGPSTVSTFPIKYQVDGGAIESDFATVTITPGGTATYTFDVSYDFSVPGTYDLCVWTDFAGDSDEGNDMICVTITSLATPSVDLGPNMTVCDLVTLDAGNVGSIYSWSTGESTQTIDVTESGTYSVTVTNPTTGCSVTDEVTVTVNYTPEASFTYSASGLTVTFTNTSTDGASYSWSFGDAGTSTTINPSHTYAVTGMYTVSLTVTNPCGSDTYSMVVEVGNGVNDITLAEAVEITPNPTSDYATVQVSLPVSADIQFKLTDYLGQEVWSANMTNSLSATYVIDMTKFAAGVYQLNIISDDAVVGKQIVLTK